MKSQSHFTGEETEAWPRGFTCTENITVLITSVHCDKNSPPQKLGGGYLSSQFQRGFGSFTPRLVGREPSVDTCGRGSSSQADTTARIMGAQNLPRPKSNSDFSASQTLLPKGSEAFKTWIPTQPQNLTPTIYPTCMMFQGYAGTELVGVANRGPNHERESMPDSACVIRIQRLDSPETWDRKKSIK